MTLDATADAHETPHATRCAVCATPLVGHYCHACGQPSPAAERGLREALTGQTGKLVYTLKRLLIPGALAREIDQGRDRLAVRSLTLLLNLVPLFFLFGGGTSGFSAHSFIASDPSGQLPAAVAGIGERRGIAPPLFEERVEERFKAVYSVMVIVQALAYGGALGVLERRKRKAWLVHFATAIHYLCFNFIVSAVAFTAFRLAHASLAEHPAIGAVAILLNASYMAASVHRVYDDTWAVAIGKTALILAFGFCVAVVLNLGAVAIAVFTA